MVIIESDIIFALTLQLQLGKSLEFAVCNFRDPSHELQIISHRDNLQTDDILTELIRKDTVAHCMLCRFKFLVFTVQTKNSPCLMKVGDI